MSKYNLTIEYVMKYGGRCRDCADEDGICPLNGTPCDPQVMRSAIKHTLEALEYGVSKEFIETPFPRPTPAPCDELETVERQYNDNGFWKITKIWNVQENKGFQIRELVTRQNAEEVIAAKDRNIKLLLGRIGRAAEERSTLEADNKRLREALIKISRGSYDGLEVTSLSVKRVKAIARAALGEVKP